MEDPPGSSGRPPARPMPPGFREDIPERVIEASTRADGSVRKPIRVRAGYVNQDEVQKYRPGAFRRLKQEAEAGGGLGPPATPEGRPADARVRGEGGRDRPGPSPASRGGASPGEPPESASASKPAAAADAAELNPPDPLEAAGEGGGDGVREGGDRSEKGPAAAAAAAASPLDEWSALDEELEKALARGGKKKRGKNASQRS